ncbi:MAG: hypothetical protein GXW94_18920 [Serratia liquefaciens]|nr:hypothetical protein [Serratia liquefaciens]
MRIDRTLTVVQKWGEVDRFIAQRDKLVWQAVERGGILISDFLLFYT